MTKFKQKRGLGKGLSVLLHETAEVSAESAATREGASGSRELPIDLLSPNPRQPRESFDPEAMNELVRSIESNGVLQPVLVRPSAARQGHFEIVAGERRWRAAQQAGFHTVPVFIRDIDDGAALQAAVIENVQRVDLNPVEEARGYSELQEHFGHSQEDLSGLVGKSRPHIANALRLLRLPKTVLKLLESGALSSGHARPLIGHPDAATLAKRIVTDQLSVRQAERLALTKRPTQPKPKLEKNPDIVELEGRLSAAVGSKVQIQDRGGAGEIRITYASYEEFDRLGSILTGVNLA